METSVTEGRTLQDACDGRQDYMETNVTEGRTLQDACDGRQDYMETNVMEENMPLEPNAYIYNQFGIVEVDLKSYSPLVLAYIGDGVYELVLRTVFVGQGNRQVNKLHRLCSHYTKARAQSEIVDILLPHMTETEKETFRKGRNAKSYTTAKNASVNDYRRATGLEALVGYLYLSGEFSRLVGLIKIGVEAYEPQEEKDAEARNREGKWKRKKRKSKDGTRS